MLGWALQSSIFRWDMTPEASDGPSLSCNACSTTSGRACAEIGHYLGHGSMFIALDRSTRACHAYPRSTITTHDQVRGMAHFGRPPHPLQAQRHCNEAMPPPSPVFAQWRSQSAGRTPRLFRPASLLPEERTELPHLARHLHRTWPPRTRGASSEPWHSGSLHGDAKNNHVQR